MEDLHETWSHRWITPKAKPYNSEIDRLGVIATKNISKGEDIGVLGGVIVPKDQIRKYLDKVGHVGIQIDEGFFIVPTSTKELEENGVFNHSCNPNCGFSGSIKLIAIEDIEKGEELAFDYAFCETAIDDFECNCGVEDCRKVIKSTDWKIPELQEKYGEYFSPYLKAKFIN